MRHDVSFLLLLLTGCGYAFTGRGVALPTGGRRVFAPTFDNATSEAGAEGYFTEAFREELANAGMAGSPDAPVQAKGKLAGVGGGPSLVYSSGNTGRLGLPASAEGPTVQSKYPGGQFFASYHVDASVCVTLMDGPATLGATCVSGSQDYAAASDPLAVEAARRTALRKLAVRMMRDCVERLSIGF